MKQIRRNDNHAVVTVQTRWGDRFAASGPSHALLPLVRWLALFTAAVAVVALLVWAAWWMWHQ